MESVEERWTSDVDHDTLRSRLIFLKQRTAYRFALGYAKGRNVLDVGCGSGYGTHMLSKWATAVVGIDENEEALDYCTTRYGDTRNLKFSKKALGAYDVVTCFQVLEHIKESDAEDFVKMLYNAGRETVIITTPNAGRRWLRRGQKPWNPEHHREYREDELRQLLTRVSPHVEICGIHGSPDADSLERARISGAELKLSVGRNVTVEGFNEDDFAIGPAEGALDLLAVMR